MWHHFLPLRHEVNLWRVPLQLSLAAIVLFGVTVGIDVLSAQGVINLPSWISNGGIDDARSILSSEMGAVSTVLALIFSVALLVLSMVATLFGFRLLYRFVQDWVTQTTIGLFLATFIYILLAYIVTRSDQNSVFVPQVTLLTASVLVVASFAFLVFYSHRIAVSIQNPDMIALIVKDMESALKYVHKFERGRCNTSTAAASAALNQTNTPALVKSVRSGYLQELEHIRMLDTATHANGEIELIFRPGQFVQTNDVLARIYPESALPALHKVVLDSVRIGGHRVLSQDAEFGLYQIVEIGIRALSPAVNDTFTGVACVDCIGDALRILLSSPSYDGCWYDKNGVLRVKEPPLKFERLVKVAFEQIRQASSDNPAVLVRILSTIKRLAPLLRNDLERQAMLDQASAIWEAASFTGRLASVDRKDVESAWLHAHASLTPNSALPN
jgi:uncharacterized membrane protein